MVGRMSSNVCPKCQQPIILPQEEVVVVKMRTGLKGRPEDRMVHRVCPTATASGQPGGQEYCSKCTHPMTMHTPKCAYSGYGYSCDCKNFKK